MTTSQPNPTVFLTTRWSLATRTSAAENPCPTDALDELLRRYRYPVYAYVRSCGHAPDAALGIVDGFLGHMRRHATTPAEPAERTHFRDFLLGRLRAWLADDWRTLQDFEASESPGATDDLEPRYASDALRGTDAERVFQRAFALEVLVRAIDRLRAEAIQSGHLDMYEALCEFLAHDPVPGGYDEVASALGTRPLAVVVALKRLRQRLRELAGEELADTVASADGLATEQQALLTILQPRM